MKENAFQFAPIAVMGSTGSVGTQALDVAEQHGISVRAVCAAGNVAEVERQVRKYHVPMCAMERESAARDLKARLADTDVCVFAGQDGIREMIRSTDAETVVNAVSGEAGLVSTLETIDVRKRLALANKESLVVAGDIVMRRARENGVPVLPVDSEHCAISQAMRAGRPQEVKKILLTASGGPFYGYSREQLQGVTVEDTLRHPTWNMGAKITVDSATLMNKGFEWIEAVHLFGVKPEQVQVVVHRESIIHSAVEYIDHSIIAQMAVPDMRLCIQNALTEPERVSASVRELDLFEVGHLTFVRPDTEAFPLLALAGEAIRAGGALPAVVNAANEIAVAAFLEKRIGFSDIFRVVCDAAEQLNSASGTSDLDGILAFDAEARRIASERISENRR